MNWSCSMFFILFKVLIVNLSSLAFFHFVEKGIIRNIGISSDLNLPAAYENERDESKTGALFIQLKINTGDNVFFQSYAQYRRLTLSYSSKK